MSNLENRYRRLLRVLPRWYRAEREEEMVGLFLADRTDDLDLEHSWPGWGETGATIALATRTRFAASGAPARTVAIGDVVRLIALIGLLAHTAYALQGLLSHVLPPDTGVPGPRWTPYALTLALADLAPAAGSLAMLTGHRRVAKAVFAALSVLSLVRLVDADPSTLPLTVLWQVPLWLTTLALFAGFHHDAPTPALGRWRWALAGVVLVGGTALVVTALVAPYAVTTTILVPAGVVVAGVVHLVRRGGVVGSLALGAWIAALLPVQLLYVAISGPKLAASMAVVGMALLVVGLRQLRRPARTVTP